MPGFDESIASALECRIGPGPWHISRLEELLEVLLASGADTPGEEACSQALHSDTSTVRRRRSSVVPSNWRDFGLQQLEDALESALAADADSPERVHSLDADGDEPKIMHPQEAEDAEANLSQLQGSILDQVVAPLLERAGDGGDGELALRELPAVVEELVGLLRRTWRLAHARGNQAAQLRRSLLAARADARAQADRAARAEAGRAAAEADAHEQLEATAAKLEALREAQRKRQAEASEACHRAEQLERSGAAQAERIRQLEARARGEAERRAAEVEQAATAAGSGVAGPSEAGPKEDVSAALVEEVDLHRQQEQELRQRLSVTEVELSAVRDELGAAELRGQDLRERSERRVADLEAQLAESTEIAQEAERRFKVAMRQVQLQAVQAAPVAASSATTTSDPSAASSSARASSLKGGGGQQAGTEDSRQRRVRGSVPVQPTYGTLSEELQAQQRGRRHTDSAVHRSSSLKEGIASKDRGVAGKDAMGKDKSARALDLRSLSKLLTGGIIRG